MPKFYNFEKITNKFNNFEKIKKIEKKYQNFKISKKTITKKCQRCMSTLVISSTDTPSECVFWRSIEISASMAVLQKHYFDVIIKSW